MSSKVDPMSMGLDECRDWLAAWHGWERTGEESWKRGQGPSWNTDDGTLAFCRHPIPPTLDAAAAALPEGWVPNIAMDLDYKKRWVWCAHGTRRDAVGTRGCVGMNVRDVEADTEVLARFRLAVACIIADQSPRNGEERANA